MPFVRVLSVAVAALIVAPSIARADTTTMGTLTYSFTYSLKQSVTARDSSNNAATCGTMSDTMAKT